MAEVKKPINSSNNKNKIKIWDIWVRIFHWSLLLLVGLSFYSGKFGGLDFVLPIKNTVIFNMDVHVWSGLAILGLILFRTIWGFVGSTTARFSYIFESIRKLPNYLRKMFIEKTTFIAGHNPAGGIAVLIIITMLFMQTITGLFSQDDSFFATKGPLSFLVEDTTSKQITQIHAQIWNYILVPLIALHICANLFYWIIKKQDLIQGMITGKRTIHSNSKNPKLYFAPTLLGILAGAVAIIIIVIITKAEVLVKI